MIGTSNHLKSLKQEHLLYSRLSMNSLYNGMSVPGGWEFQGDGSSRGMSVMGMGV